MFNRLRHQLKNSYHQHAKKKAAANLLNAVESGNLKQVTKIVSEFGNDSEIINTTLPLQPSEYKVYHGPTPLITAAGRGDLAIVKALLKAACIDLNISDDDVSIAITPPLNAPGTNAVGTT